MRLIACGLSARRASRAGSWWIAADPDRIAPHRNLQRSARSLRGASLALTRPLAEKLPENPAIVRDVLAYFLRTRARATLPNVAEWRLRQEIIHRTTGEVDAALNWLTEPPHDILCRDEDGAAGAPVFRLNDEKVVDAERLLAWLSGVRHRSSAPATPLMTQVRAWIDSTLARYDRLRSTTSSDQLGFTRDPEAIQRLLSHEAAEESGAGASTLAADTRDLVDAIESAPHDDPLRALLMNLALSELELQFVLLALASEFDATYHTVFGLLNDDMGRRAITLGLACAILGDPAEVRYEIERTGALVRWRLLEGGAVLPHADDALRLDPFLIAWLFGDRDALARDPRVAPLVRQEAWQGADWLRSPDETAFIETLRRRLSRETKHRRAARMEWTAIAGGDRNGSRPSIEEAVRQVGGALLRIVLPPPATFDPRDVDEAIIRVARAAALLDATAAVDVDGLSADALGPAGLARMLEELSAGAACLVVVASDVERIVGAFPKTPGRVLDSPLPTHDTLAGVYEKVARDAGLYIEAGEAEQLAATFPQPHAAIHNAARLAALRIRDTGASCAQHYAAFFDAARRVASPDLPRYGTRVEPIFTLDDVVLPAEQRAEMDEIVAHVRHATQVMHRWGFERRVVYGRGVTALFSGPSGTGKTMAAQAIARALGTDAWVIDLSKILSRYIGDSEQRLDAVFTDAERAGVVLAFDEADALFGKRSETKDAQDRYANFEVAFLLQRMDAYSGLAILTTNFRQNLDPAFVRRLRFIIEFRKPDVAAREAIWHRSLDASAPVASNVNFNFLARRLDLTGGTIQQIAIRSAFAAAAARAPEIRMEHIVAAARAELLKLGLVSAERQLAAFDAGLKRHAAHVA